MNMFDASLFFLNHVHDQKGQRLVKLGADSTCTKLVARDTIGVISGSYLSSYCQGITGYSERKGYAPVPLGSVKVQIDAEHHRIVGEV